jgi:hypothetical protein
MTLVEFHPKCVAKRWSLAVLGYLQLQSLYVVRARGLHGEHPLPGPTEDHHADP